MSTQLPSNLYTDQYRPTQIPEGTVASRIQAYQQQCHQRDQQNLSDIDSLTTSIHTSDHAKGASHDKNSHILNTLSSRPTNDGLFQYSSNSQHLFSNPLRLGRFYRSSSSNYVDPCPAPIIMREVSSNGSATFDDQFRNAQYQYSDHILARQHDGILEPTKNVSQQPSHETEPELNEHHSLAATSPMFDLGTMLQDAIDQGDEGDAHAHFSHKSYPSVAESSESGLSSTQSFRVVHSAREFHEDVREPLATDIDRSNLHSTENRGLFRSQIVNDLEEIRERTYDQDLTLESKNSRPVEIMTEEEDHNTSRSTALQIPSTRLPGPYFRPDLPLFPRFRSNQGVQGEAAAALDIHGASLSQRNHTVKGFGNRNDISIQPGHKFACRRLEHKPRTSEDERRLCLLPLALPRMPEVTEEERPASTASTLSKPDHLSVASHSHTRNTESFGAEREEKSNKFTVLHAVSDSKRRTSKAETPFYDEHAAITPSRGTEKGPSIIESRIRDLLTASRKHDITSSQSSGITNLRKTYDTLIHRNISGAHSNKENSMPAHHSPPAVKTENLNTYGARTLKTLKYNNEKRTPSPMRRVAGNANTALASPSTKRCKDLADTPSPRSSGYSLEQKFAFSPPRCQSRASSNAVRVSFEIRRSPERGDRGDQMFIVRASVDPEEDEIFESSA